MMSHLLWPVMKSMPVVQICSICYLCIFWRFY